MPVEEEEEESVVRSGMKRKRHTEDGYAVKRAKRIVAGGDWHSITSLLS